MLIDRSEIRVFKEELQPASPPAATVSGGAAQFALSRANTSLQEAIGPSFDPDQHYHIVSKGAWSMHDVLAYVLQRSGPADVWITSWTITENPMRLILDLITQGQIGRFRALFNERVEAMNPIAHQVARMNMDIRLTKIHAKCIVAINDRWGVSVTGSANFTRNPRIERYVISTFRSVAVADREWIDAEMNGAKPFRTDG